VQALRKILQPILSQVSPADMRKRLTGETDAERTQRGQKEALGFERAARAAAEANRAAAKNGSTGSSTGGYKTGSFTAAATAGKKKGKKH